MAAENVRPPFFIYIAFFIKCLILGHFFRSITRGHIELENLHRTTRSSEIRRKTGQGAAILQRPCNRHKCLGVRMGAVFALAKTFIDLSLDEIEKLLESKYYEVPIGGVCVMDFQARHKKTTQIRRKELFDLYAGGDKDYKGHEFIRRFAGQLRSAIPDIQIVEVALLIQADDSVAWKHTLSGTHKAENMCDEQNRCQHNIYLAPFLSFGILIADVSLFLLMFFFSKSSVYFSAYSSSVLKRSKASMWGMWPSPF